MEHDSLSKPPVPAPDLWVNEPVIVGGILTRRRTEALCVYAPVNRRTGEMDMDALITDPDDTRALATPWAWQKFSLTPVES